MARPDSFNDFEINKFAGLDLRGPVELQPEKTLQKCINFEVGLLGELRKRPGFKQQSFGAALGTAVNGLKILGELNSNTTHDLIVQCDFSAGAGKVYRSVDSGATFTQISTPSTTDYSCGKGVQYGSAIHFMSLQGLMRWDGSTWATFTAAGIPRSNYKSTVLQNRLFCIETSTKNIRYSDPGAFDTWPSGNSIGFVSEERDALVGIIPYRDRLVCLRQSSIHVINMNGPPSSWNVKRLPFDVGVFNENCAIVYNDLLYLLSYDGIYRTDLTQMEEISKPIAPAFVKRRNTVFAGAFGRYLDSMAYWNGRMICSVNTGASAFRMFVFNIDNNTWTEWLPSYPNVSGYAYEPPRDMFSVQIGKKYSAANYVSEGVYVSNWNNGSIFFFDDQSPVYGDGPGGGTAFSTVVRTKATDANIPSQLKRCARFSTRAIKGTGTATTLNGIYNVNGVDGTSFTIPVDNTRKQTRMRGPGWFRELAFEVNDVSNQYIEIEDFVVSLKRKSDISEVAT